MNHVLAIAAGGAIGAVLRYGVIQGVQQIAGKGFPFGTLVANVLGSLLIGVLAILLLEKWQASTELRAFLTIGILGAFTTFSTFSMETVTLLQSGAHIKALSNIGLSVVLCLAGTWLGITVAKQFV
ncbi:MAG: fluoride efflux transporter CrcB [Gammaproteobacteria bacterium]|nr:fluoride efflux transporter CrcB [Gammaproteobacteria bacterium]